MEYKTLNTVDALRVAQIITKYIKTDTVSEMTGEDFLLELLSEINENELVELSDLLEIPAGLETEQYMEALVRALIKNDLVKLLDFYNSTFGAANGK